MPFVITGKPAPEYEDDGTYPLDPITAEETLVAADAVRKELGAYADLRFNAITLAEPPKAELRAWKTGVGAKPKRMADVIAMVTFISTAI
eukprot:scaffold89162_cov20-Prasinocladus_malaysianus.AAC.1